MKSQFGRVLAAVWAGLVLTGAAAEDPFAVTARLARADAAWQVVVTVDVPTGHKLYADQRFSVRIDGRTLPGRITPQPVVQPDAMGEMESVYASPVTAVYPLAKVADAIRLEVKLQGCTETYCLPPRTVRLELTPDGGARAVADADRADTDRSAWLTGFRLSGSAAGYLAAPEFLAFLDQAAGKATDDAPRGWLRQFVESPVAFLQRYGIFWTGLLVIIGGLLLNLTPCVLPMIPINLGIIGAGASAGSDAAARSRGLWLGAAYGCGIALVYGALGVVVVLTGSVFGSLQGSPWFNAAIAALFLVMGLALFDLIMIDFSRFQKSGGNGGRFGTAVVAGGISALLAGACVAPVVMAVLVLAGALFAQGERAALLLPFLLGVGMALPWPLAGAGISFLPKPGRWMAWVKYGFGVLVVLMALYYGRLAWQGFRPSPPVGSIIAGDAEAWQAALARARAQGRPVFVDFWATWCKNCTVMEHGTFREPDVVARLREYEVIKVQAERPDAEPARTMLRAFEVGGLPTYLVLTPDGN